jgi:hypothetical protein
MGSRVCTDGIRVQWSCYPSVLAAANPPHNRCSLPTLSSARLVEGGADQGRAAPPITTHAFRGRTSPMMLAWVRAGRASPRCDHGEASPRDVTV